MTNIAFIGLGIMGAPMAVNLAKAGFAVTGHNRSPRYDALLEAGGSSADTVAEAVAEADVIITMVPDSPDVAAVLQGEHGVFASAQAGALIIDFSTIRPDVAQELAAEAQEKGLRMLDAPVSGGEPGAINAALSIMVGGDAADFAEAGPVFDAVGKTIVHVGPSGSGQTVKAANQLIVATNIAALSEAVVFLDRTPFYAESGGQVGDTGELEGQGVRFTVADTRKYAGQFHGHAGKLVAGALRVGDHLVASVGCVVGKAAPEATSCRARNSAVDPVAQLLLTLTTGMPLMPIRYSAACPQVESP